MAQHYRRTGFLSMPLERSVRVYYNAYNQRTKKVAGTTTHYVYGTGGLLYGESDTAGALIREYVYLNGAPLAQINAGSPETLTYLHPDHLGTPKFGTNAGGTQVWAWAPDAFGNGAPSGSVTVNIRMPGQYFDAESGLFYNWNRYYNPVIGRYISSDPIGLEGGINTFLYAAASPVMNIDPDGQFAILLPLFSGASVSLPSAATIAAYGVAIADGLAKATAGIILMSSLTGDIATDNASQQAERKAYNRVCIEPIPRTGDPCTDAKNKLNRQKQCLQMREDYGRKWYNDSDHEGHNEQIRRSIKNLEDWIRDNCKEGCDGQQ